MLRVRLPSLASGYISISKRQADGRCPSRLPDPLHFLDGHQPSNLHRAMIFQARGGVRFWSGPQAIVAAISPWIGRRAELSGRRPLLLVGWGLIPLQALLYATLPDVVALVFGSLLNAFSAAIFGVAMTVVAADLTRQTGCFNLTLGALGVAVSLGASLSTFCTGISATLFGIRAAALGLVLVGLCGLLLLWTAMPETRPPQRMPEGTVAAD